jgi:adenine-specific DNA-methyltransferase
MITDYHAKYFAHHLDLLGGKALEVKKPDSDEYSVCYVDLLETFNYLTGLRVQHIAAPVSFTAGFERMKDPELPKDQNTRLVVSGKILQDEEGPWWFRKVDTIYVNGSNNLSKLKLDVDTWKVRLTEEKFMKRMWDVKQ